MKRSADAPAGANSRTLASPSKRPRKALPKKPHSAYNIFFMQARPELLESNARGKPQSDFDENLKNAIEGGKKKHSEALFQAASRTIANRWKAMSADDKLPYERQAAEATIKYKADMKDYEDQMMQDSLALRRQHAAVASSTTTTLREDGPLAGPPLAAYTTPSISSVGLPATLPPVQHVPDYQRQPHQHSFSAAGLSLRAADPIRLSSTPSRLASPLDRLNLPPTGTSQFPGLPLGAAARGLVLNQNHHLPPPPDPTRFEQMAAFHQGFPQSTAATAASGQHSMDGLSAGQQNNNNNNPALHEIFERRRREMEQLQALSLLAWSSSSTQAPPLSSDPLSASLVPSLLQRAAQQHQQQQQQLHLIETMAQLPLPVQPVQQQMQLPPSAQIQQQQQPPPPQAHQPLQQQADRQLTDSELIRCALELERQRLRRLRRDL